MVRRMGNRGRVSVPRMELRAGHGEENVVDAPMAKCFLKKGFMLLRARQKGSASNAGQLTIVLQNAKATRTSNRTTLSGLRR